MRRAVLLLFVQKSHLTIFKFKNESSKSVQHSPPGYSDMKKKYLKCQTRRCMCANIRSKLFRPNCFFKLRKHLSIQSSCLQEKFTLTVEGDDERGTRETICHSWASRGCREHGPFITVWPGSSTHIPDHTEATQLPSQPLRYVHSHLENTALIQTPHIDLIHFTHIHTLHTALTQSPHH